jgi:hypothetical protein
MTPDPGSTPRRSGTFEPRPLGLAPAPGKPQSGETKSEQGQGVWFGYGTIL